MGSGCVHIVIGRDVPSKEETLVEVVTTHIIPDLDREQQRYSLLGKDSAQCQITGGTDSVRKEVVDIRLSDRSERRAGSQRCILIDPNLEFIVHQLDGSLYTFLVSCICAALVAGVEQNLGLDEASLCVCSDISRGRDT